MRRAKHPPARGVAGSRLSDLPAFPPVRTTRRCPAPARAGTTELRAPRAPAFPAERPSGVDVRGEDDRRPASARGGPSADWALLWRELRKGIASLASELDETEDEPALEAVRAYATRYLRLTSAVFESLICLVEEARESEASRELPLDAALTRCVASVYDWSARLTSEVEEALREERAGPGDVGDLARHIAEFSAIEVRGFVQPRLTEARARCRDALARDFGLRGVEALIDRLEASVVDLNWELRSA